jgi:DNA-binding response OmpR family regulator
MNHRILLIDGDNRFAQDLRQACADKNLDLLVATTGSQGLDLTWGELPSAVVLSVELPDTNGFLLCNALKKNLKLQKIPLVLISGQEDQRVFSRHATLKGRADKYFQKGASVSSLISELAPLLSIPRDQWLPSISGIQAEKPVLQKSTSSIAIWIVIFVLVALSIFWFTTLK